MPRRDRSSFSEASRASRAGAAPRPSKVLSSFSEMSRNLGVRVRVRVRVRVSVSIVVIESQSLGDLEADE